MKRWSLLFLVVGLLVGVVAGLLLDQGVSAQGARVQGTVIYLDTPMPGVLDLSTLRPPLGGRAVAYCFTGGGGIHCLPAR